MMAVKIKQIDVQAFRGIRDLTVDLDGKNLLLRGDNGTGKSSLIDAIEFFFRGGVSHLEHVQGLSLQKHATHVKHKSSEVEVDITFNPGEILLSRTYGSAPTYPTQLADYFATAKNSSFILRRSQILEFIEVQPADRFRSIANIIGIEKLDQYELSLMRVRDKLDADIKETDELIAGIKNDLRTILQHEIKDSNDVHTALNEYLNKVGLPIIPSLDAIDKHAENMLNSVKPKENIAKTESVESLLLITKELIGTESLQTEIAVVNGKYSNLPKASASDKLMADLLGNGINIMQRLNQNYCPLCEQAISRQALIDSINSRLKFIKDLSVQASELRASAGGAKAKAEELLSKIRAAIARLGLIPEMEKEKTKMTEYVGILEKLMYDIDSAGNGVKEISATQYRETLVEITNTFAAVYKSCQSLSQKSSVTEKDKQLIKAAELIGEVRSKLKDLDKYTKKRLQIQRHYVVAKELYSNFSDVKKLKIQNVFDAIQTSMNDYYLLLHPNDGHKDIHLKLSTGKRASLELKIESFGRKDEDPRAYSSEGHLDSLGLCIFLAFVKKFNAGCDLVILDDVVTTVDSGHRENLCKLLRQEFSDYQVIITTHDEVWYRQLRAHHKASRIEGHFKYATVSSWDIDTGPVIKPYKARWERIQEKIKDGDKTAGNDGRIYLEAVLETICETLQAPIVFRTSGEYEIGDLFPAAKNRTQALIKDPPFKEKVDTAFINVESTAIYGNILSHNNPLADQLSIGEAETYCNAVNDLNSVFLCPMCSSPMKYYREIHRLRCSNDKCGKVEVETK